MVQDNPQETPTPADAPESAGTPPPSPAPQTDAPAPEPAVAESAPPATAAASATTSADSPAPRAGRGRRRERKNVPRGRAYVQSSFNNTIITLTDTHGNTLAWGSAGATGVKGSRKSTPYAAQIAAEDAARKAMEHGLREVDVYVKGPGSGRESAVRALQASGIALRTIRDVTPIPHNGCRPRKRRRV